jgi:hypothetical protein
MVICCRTHREGVADGIQLSAGVAVVEDQELQTGPGARVDVPDRLELQVGSSEYLRRCGATDGDKPLVARRGLIDADGAKHDPRSLRVREIRGCSLMTKPAVSNYWLVSTELEVAVLVTAIIA